MPVGVPVPGASGATVARIVSAWPLTHGCGGVTVKAVVVPESPTVSDTGFDTLPRSLVLAL